MLDAVLQRHRGQFAAAARQLGLHRVTLKKKTEQLKAEDVKWDQLKAEQFKGTRK